MRFLTPILTAALATLVGLLAAMALLAASGRSDPIEDGRNPGRMADERRWRGRDGRDASPAVAGRADAPAGRAVAGTVTRVVDGDTMHVRLADGTVVTVRVIGIDAPELHAPELPACLAIEARAALAALTAGRRVRLSPEAEVHDRYGRLLADVTVRDGPHRGTDVASMQVRTGRARTMPISPNTDHAPRLLRLEASARTAGRGLWSRCGEAAAYPTRQ